MASDCKSRSDTGQFSARCSRSNQAKIQDQRIKGASSVGNLKILHGSASREGQGYSFAALQLQRWEATSLWIRRALIMWCATVLSVVDLRAGTKGQVCRTPSAHCQGLRLKDQ